MTGKPKYWIWALLTLPAVWIGLSLQTDRLSYGGAIHESGLWSAGFLLLTLCVTPARRLFASFMWPRRLMYHRRALGVASFFYAALHTAIYLERKIPLGKVKRSGLTPSLITLPSGIYLERKIPLGKVMSEGVRPDLLTGWLAFAIFTGLALTSNRKSVLKLGKRWQTLHRSVYLATALMYVHWALSIFEYRVAIISFIGLIALQLLRWRKS